MNMHAFVLVVILETLSCIMAIHTDCTQLVQLQMMPKVSTTSVEAEKPLQY